jgi:hypothetical protein
VHGHSFVFVIEAWLKIFVGQKICTHSSLRRYQYLTACLNSNASTPSEEVVLPSYQKQKHGPQSKNPKTSAHH